MIKNLKNTTKAKDMIISLANKIPENLLIDSVSDYGNFTTDFLFRLTDEQLLILQAEAKEKENFILLFSTVQQNTKDSPVELITFFPFDWEKIADIKISGKTCPYQPGVSSVPIHYVSVTLVIKN